MELDGILKAHLIQIKWKKYRDTTYSFMTRFEPDEKKFTERMKLMQSIIKAFAEKNKLEIIPAIVKLADETEEAMFAVQILAAGYELCDGKDYTIVNDKIEIENAIQSEA